GLIAAAISRSHNMVTGPTNTTALLVLAALLPHLTANGVVDARGLAALGTLTLLTGVLRLALSGIGGSTLVRFLPESVLVGFMCGVAVLIVVMQLDEAMGLSHVVGTGLASEAASLTRAFQAGIYPKWTAIAVTIVTVAMLVPLQRRYPRLPMALIVMVGSSLLAYALGLDETNGLPIVSDRTPLSRGIPPHALPSLDPDIVEAFLTPAAAIALLGTLELTAVLRSDGLRVDMRREIRAQALANIVGSLVSAQPASVSLTRSALLRQMPNTTRIAPIVTAVATIPLVIAAPLLGFVPQATLAGVLFATAYNMVDRVKVRRIWLASRKARLVLAVTLTAALLFKLEWAIVLGVAFSLVQYLADSATPRLRLYVPAYGMRLNPYVKGEAADIIIVEVSGELHFAAAQAFLTEIFELMPASPKHVVLDLSHAHAMRFTALVAFEELEAELAAQDAKLHIAGVSTEFASVLHKAESSLDVTPAFDEPGRSVQEAMRAFHIDPSLTETARLARFFGKGN
ncbi:MAG TPA: SulP family inorganic anion transporter, partial [Myxococcota bacterium]|nr:SulP family inorganic anion transporter [Myxococcota bacterium]